MAITTQFLTGFEHGCYAVGGTDISGITAGGGLWDTGPTSGAPLSMSTTTPRNGTYCAHFVRPANTRVNLIKNITGTPTKVVFRCGIKLSARPSSGTPIILFGGASAVTFNFNVSSTGTLAAQVGTGTPQTYGSALTTTDWYLLEAQVDVHANPWTLDWKVNGVAQTQATSATALSTHASIALGTYNSGTQAGYTCDYDDFIFGTYTGASPSSTEWYGDGQVLAQFPGSDGTHSFGNNLFSKGDAGALIATGTSLTDAYTFVDSPPGTSGWGATRSTTDNLAMRAVNTANYLEIAPATTAQTGSANAVRAILSYSSSGTSINAAACGIRNSAGTITDLWGTLGGALQDWSEGTNFFKGSIVAVPVAGWTATEVNALRWRFGGGTSSDISPVPTVQEFMLEVDWPVSGIINITITAVPATSTAAAPVPTTITATQNPTVTAIDADSIATAPVPTLVNARAPPSAGATSTAPTPRVGNNAYETLISSESGLVSYWRLGEASGNALDSADTNPGTTVAGGITRNVAGLLYQNVDGAVQGDGVTGSYIDAPYHSNMNTGAQLSLELWLKASTAWVPNSNVIGRGTNGLPCMIQVIDSGSTTRARFYVRDVNNVDTQVTIPGLTLALNTVYHIVGVYDAAGTCALYVNGVSVAAPSRTPNANVQTATSDLYQFAAGAAGAAFNGVIDECALYNVALTPAQVAAHYTAGSNNVRLVLPSAGSTSTAPAPTVSSNQNVTITAVAASCTSAAPAPSTSIVSSPTITAVSASSTSTAPAPAVSSATNVTITAVSASSTSAAPISTVAVAIAAVSAGSTSTAPVPTVVPSQNVTIAGGPLTYALVGTAGAENTTGVTSGDLNNLAWGTGETRSLDNLLILAVQCYGTATLPSAPSGWLIATQVAGTSCSASIFYRIATGSDAVPTVTGVTGGILFGNLNEFSGNATSSIVDQTNTVASTASPLVLATPSTDATSGELNIWTNAAPFSISTAINPITVVCNNGNSHGLAQNPSAAVNHYETYYAITTTNSGADSWTYTPNTSANIIGQATALVSFKVGVSGISAGATSTAPVPTVVASQDATVTAVAATSTSSASVPTVTSTQNPTITAVAASGTSAAPVPVPQLTLSPPAAGSTSTAPVPTLSIVFNASVTAVSAGASSAAPSPTVTTTQNPTISAVAASATSTAPIPTVASTQTRTVTAVAGSASANAPVPTVVAVQNITITAATAGATSSAPVPTVTATRNPTIIAVAASATATAPVSALEIDEADTAPSAGVVATAPAPTVTATQNPTIVAVAAGAITTAPVPTVSATQNVTITAVSASGSAGSSSPTVTSTQNATIIAVAASAISTAPPVFIGTVISLDANPANATADGVAPTTSASTNVSNASATASSLADASVSAYAPSCASSASSTAPTTSEASSAPQGAATASTSASSTSASAVPNGNATATAYPPTITIVSTETNIDVNAAIATATTSATSTLKSYPPLAAAQGTAYPPTIEIIKTATSIDVNAATAQATARSSTKRSSNAPWAQAQAVLYASDHIEAIVPPAIADADVWMPTFGGTRSPLVIPGGDIGRNVVGHIVENRGFMTHAKPLGSIGRAITGYIARSKG